MKRRFLLSVLILPWLCSFVVAAERQPLRLLFVGADNSPRTNAFRTLLSERFASIQVANREHFDPNVGRSFDVVILDWPQVVDAALRHQGPSPLGEREKWDRPTVLLGSAGLMLACKWDTLGGFGCTCLQPYAYNVRDHIVLKQPNPIAIDKTVRRRVPGEFAKVLGQPMVDAVALVSDVNQTYPAGWATHIDELLESPDVEVISGGINDQTPRSVAIWRQGNLTHFGFEQSPDQMNDTGRDLLVNTIVYASRFSEDRPIGRTLSVFVHDDYPRTRTRIARWATDMNDEDVERFFDEPQLKGASAGKAWFAENRQWLHAGQDGRLTLDTDAKKLGWTIGDVDAVSKLLDRFDSDPTIRTLLVRYVPDGPGAGANATAWRSWWNDHREYVFFSEAGGYRFYTDPLAMKRHIPTARLRGPLRADRPSTQ
jgi:hypothetical protein